MIKKVNLSFSHVVREKKAKRTLKVVEGIVRANGPGRGQRFWT